MSDDQITYLSSETLDEDREALVGLRTLTDYVPLSEDVSIETANTKEELYLRTEQAVIEATKVLATARDARDAARRSFHSTMLNIKRAVRWQYGPSSNAVKLLGLKKKSDYQRPRRNKKAA